MNLVFIIIDSLRADHVGINGNDWIKTPNLDKFGAQSVRFTNALPESLPTMPVRRAMATGRRVFPFKDWRYWKPVPVPGWQPSRRPSPPWRRPCGQRLYHGHVHGLLPSFQARRQFPPGL